VISVWFLWASAAGAGAGYLLFAWVVSGKFGSVIRAIRDNEARVRFLGYPVEGYKLFVFTLTAMIAGIAGALYYPQAGIINPAELAPIASIYLAVWVAIGGRGRLYGAVIGAAFVAAVKLVHRRATRPTSTLGFYTINWVDWWLVLLGLSFVAVTLLWPQGHRRAVRPVRGPPHAAARGRGTRLAPMTGRCARRRRWNDHALLEVSGVSVTFDGFRAINNLSFSHRRAPNCARSSGRMARARPPSWIS
jgi:hypothetical protein